MAFFSYAYVGVLLWHTVGFTSLQMNPKKNVLWRTALWHSFQEIITVFVISSKIFITAG